MKRILKSQKYLEKIQIWYELTPVLGDIFAETVMFFHCGFTEGNSCLCPRENSVYSRHE